MAKLISLFVCGVQKAGTTSLFSYLSAHPQISAPTRKELHIFDDESIDWSQPGCDIVDTYFPGDDGSGVRIDVTPIYCFWPPAMERLQRYNPSAKLVCIFREPIERAWSNWRMEYARGNEHLSFADAIRGGRTRLHGLPDTAPERRLFSYIERGQYGEQVRRMRETFPADQLLFLRFEDLINDYTHVLERIAAHAGIESFPRTGPMHEHIGATMSLESLPSAADRRLIAESVADSLCEFAAITNLDISAWESAPASATSPRLEPIQ